MNGLALCAGVGGLELGVRLALGRGYRTVCHVEREAFAAACLVARMEDKALDQAPVWDDLATFDGKPWRGVVDLVSAGFPCPPFSSAGKRQGIKDDRWLWPLIRPVLEDVRPSVVFIEQVDDFLGHPEAVGWLLSDLHALGFDAEWSLVSAASVGAPQLQPRLAPRNSDSGSTSSLWPTPDANAFNDGDSKFFDRREQLKTKKYNGNGAGTPLAVEAAHWPTPRALDAEQRGVWPTTTARDAVGSRNTNVGHSGTTLTDAVKLWSTPTARDTKGQDQPGRAAGPSLVNQSRSWPTPMANDGIKPSAGNRRDADLSHSASSHPARTTSPDGHECSESCRRLNPLFAQWLMGWPAGWTNPDVATDPSSFAAWETVSSLWLRHLLSGVSL